MTQVHTAPFLLVRPTSEPVRHSAEVLRLDRRLHRCQHVFAFVMCSMVALLAIEVQIALSTGIPFVRLP